MAERGTGVYSQLRQWIENRYRSRGPTSLLQAQRHFPETRPKVIAQYLGRLKDKGAIEKRLDGRYAPRGARMKGDSGGYSFTALQAAWPAWGPVPERIIPTRRIGGGIWG